MLYIYIGFQTLRITRLCETMAVTFLRYEGYAWYRSIFA